MFQIPGALAFQRSKGQDHKATCWCISLHYDCRHILLHHWILLKESERILLSCCDIVPPCSTAVVLWLVGKFLNNGAINVYCNLVCEMSQIGFRIVVFCILFVYFVNSPDTQQIQMTRKRVRWLFVIYYLYWKAALYFFCQTVATKSMVTVRRSRCCVIVLIVYLFYFPTCVKSLWNLLFIIFLVKSRVKTILTIMSHTVTTL